MAEEGQNIFAFYGQWLDESRKAAHNLLRETRPIAQTLDDGFQMEGSVLPSIYTMERMKIYADLFSEVGKAFDRDTAIVDLFRPQNLPTRPLPAAQPIHELIPLPLGQHALKRQLTREKEKRRLERSKEEWKRMQEKARPEQGTAARYKRNALFK